jgi:methoxymalonate biosynthesis protein
VTTALETSAQQTPGAVPEPLAALLRDPGLRKKADRWERDGTVPRADIDELAAAGLLGLTVAPEYGGTGVPLPEVTAVHRAVAGLSPSLHSLLVVHSMVCHALSRWAKGPLREEFLPELAAGARVAAFALTESTSGSDISDPRTELRRTDDGSLRVTGTKRWLSFGQTADVFLVFGHTGGAGACALVSRGPGVTVAPEPPTTGLGAAGLAALTLDEAPVPARRAVSRPGFGLPHVATDCLTLGRVLVAAGAVGVAEEALRLAARRAAATSRGGAPLGDRQLVRGLLADAAVAADSARCYVEHAAEHAAEGAPEAPQTAVRAKLLASRAAGLCTSNAVRLLGAEGLDRTHPVNRLEQAARVHQVIEGPTEVLQDLVAAGLLRTYAAGAEPAGGKGGTRDEPAA